MKVHVMVDMNTEAAMGYQFDPMQILDDKGIYLTDEHAASSYGVPVLVNRQGTAFGRGDLPRDLELYYWPGEDPGPELLERARQAEWPLQAPPAMHSMSQQQYRDLRRELGTQAEVAEMLDVTANAVALRERGERPIRREAELAIRYLAVSRQKPAQKEK